MSSFAPRSREDQRHGLLGFRLNSAPNCWGRLMVDKAVQEVLISSQGAARFLDSGGYWDGAQRYFERGAFFDVAEARFEGSTAGTSNGLLTAPMPGRVVAVEVTQGAKVTKGQRIVVIEAMKMEQALIAPFDGVVVELGPGGRRAGYRGRGAGSDRTRGSNVTGGWFEAGEQAIGSNI